MRLLLQGPHLLAFLPAMVLGAFWLGGEGWLLATALGLPALFALCGLTNSITASPRQNVQTLAEVVESTQLTAEQRGHRFGLFLLQVDDFDKLEGHHGLAVRNQLASDIVARLSSVLRPGDTIMRCGSGQYAVVLAPIPKIDLELAIQLARRMQSAIAAPHPVDGSTLYLTASAGFVLDRQLSPPIPATLIQAAEAALALARLNAPDGLRAYSPEQPTNSHRKTPSLSDLQDALESGAIRPWFQPQVSTETGELTGVEALARWQNGSQTIPPGDFLPAMEQSGLLEQLGDVMLTRSLMALSHWDRVGLTVPQVGVNFSSSELRNPDLVDKIRWALDRFDLQPARLSVEILESVIASSPDDMVVRNIRKLSELGCSVDLDDFGTGHASITSLRRFSVNRIKIDRSFVTKLDRDPEQHKLVSAILSLTEQMGLDSLAEGVENAAEYSALSQLGCQHVQGFGIARPMPADQIETWFRERESNRTPSPQIERRTG